MRRDKIIALILQGNTDQTRIARELHVSRETVYRDIKAYIDSEQDVWAHSEWMALYTKIKEDNPEKAFEGLTRVVVRTMREKTEVVGTLKLEKVGFEADPDLKKILVEEAERQRRMHTEPTAT